MKHARWQTVLCLIMVAALAFAFGWPTRNGEFLTGDDRHFITDHVFINHPSWRNAWNLLSMVHSDLYQPLPMLTFQADYALAGPDPAGQFPVSPRGFHVTNIALHMLNAALAFLVAANLAQCRRVGLLAGLLFAVHPFAVESVAWITGRMILLTTTFSLALFLVCLRRRPAREGRWGVVAIASWIGSVLSKILPSVPFAAAWCDVQRREKWTRRTWVVYAVLLLIAAAATWLALKSTYEIGFFERTREEATSSLPVRVVIASRYYFENYVWPARLCPWSPPPDRVSFLSLPSLIGVAEWAIFGAILLWSKNRCRPAFVGLVLYVLLIAPFLGATAARSFLTADRYMYLPMIGLHLAVAAALVRLFDALNKKWSLRPASLIVGAASMALLAAYLQTSWRQGRIWNDMLAQARHTLNLFPNSPDAHSELARSLANAGRLDDALIVIADARERWPDNPRLYARAGDVYRRKLDWPNAVKELSAAAERMPDHITTLYSLGRALDELGRVDEARQWYRRVLEVHPGDLHAVIALAHSYEKDGDLETALKFHRRAVEINPFHRDSLLSLAVFLMRKHEWQEAKGHLHSILKLDPDDQAALLNLGVIETRMGNVDEARALYDRLIALDTDNVTARLNRAALRLSMGRNAEAQDEFRAILTKDPLNRDAIIGLHEALQQIGQYSALVDLWREYDRISITEPERSAWLGWSLALTGDGTKAMQNALSLQPGTEPRRFANWTMAYLALTKDEHRALPNTLGPPSQPTSPSARRLEWLRVVTLAIESLPENIRYSPPGFYLLARLALENNNPSLAEQAARRTLEQTDDEALKRAANAVLQVTASVRSDESSVTTTQKSHR